MRTVGWLREELAKFPEDALCYAYEGEVIGIVIQQTSHDPFASQGVIHCSDGDDSGFETELLSIGTNE